MKASLVLKMGQQLTMTPQLQQAIRLLQMSTLDLQAEIQEALDSNPMLEVEDDNTSAGSDTKSAAQEHSSNTQASNQEETTDSNSSPAETTDWTEQIPSELEIDTSWEDIYQSSSSNLPSSNSEDWDFTSTTAAGTDLQTHLLWQLNLVKMSDSDRMIATVIIDSIGSDGYLQESLEDIQDSFDPMQHIEMDEIEMVLKRVQQFEPTGIAARNLSECLLLQLNNLPSNTAWLAQAKTLCKEHLELLGARDYNQLMRRMRIKEEALKEIVQLIQALDPRPGSTIESTEAEYIVPDVIVRKANNRWIVELNPEVAPRLGVNAQYASFVQRADNSADNTFMRTQLQEARWFIKSLQSRNETLLKVSTQILDYQRGFFDYGPEAMKPLVLAEIAEAVGMHESTISRVTTQKYMHTPRGIYELKYFFSSHVSTTQGGECSSTAIRAIIEKLVAAENPKKPLSDSKIAGLLEEQGIQVARRTIAKYREALGIASSTERKQLL
ncbi:MAG: RNA polymerase factor sigma-54 [Pseudomonas sp.]|nr:RNA polymerase factor sigma-54 [Pseudomonas sp.]